MKSTLRTDMKALLSTEAGTEKLPDMIKCLNKCDDVVQHKDKEEKDKLEMLWKLTIRDKVSGPRHTQHSEHL
jgi:hypothetical protein